MEYEGGKDHDKADTVKVRDVAEILADRLDADAAMEKAAAKTV